MLLFAGGAHHHAEGVEGLEEGEGLAVGGVDHEVSVAEPVEDIGTVERADAAAASGSKSTARPTPTETNYKAGTI